ncbi:uncharacterized protein [Manis javanica]|uniref:uncharacterized protein n=1 Tax=Manis javanica TaxID=9974 RepID=UPI003C6D1294
MIKLAEPKPHRGRCERASGARGTPGKRDRWAAPVHAGPRPTDGPPPPLPAPGLTARQTHHHTCGVLRTTAPAGLSPPLATSARLGPPSAQGRGRRGAASGREQPSPRLPPRPGPSPPARRLPGPGPGPGGGRAAAGQRAQERQRRRGGGSRAPAGREGAAAAPQPEAWRRAAGGGAGRGGACNGPPTPRGGGAGPERLRLRPDGRGRPGVAPRLLTGGEESQDPGGPGRTAEMPQTDTAAILETVSLASLGGIYLQSKPRRNLTEKFKQRWRDTIAGAETQDENLASEDGVELLTLRRSEWTPFGRVTRVTDILESGPAEPRLGA